MLQKDGRARFKWFRSISSLNNFLLDDLYRSVCISLSVSIDLYRSVWYPQTQSHTESQVPSTISASYTLVVLRFIASDNLWFTSFVMSLCCYIGTFR